MKRFLTALAALAALVSCEEWEPVFKLKYDNPGAGKTATLAEIQSVSTQLTIAELASRYVVGGGPIQITDNVFIAGKVSSSDRAGNVYKSMYIQDETGGIEVKVGRSGLYNDYAEGQTVYVMLQDIWLGMYGYKARNNTYNTGGNGMVQLGLEDSTGEYETSYIEEPMLIDKFVKAGEPGPRLVAAELTESQLPGWNATVSSCKYIGELVHLKNLKYGNKVFALIYLNTNYDKKESANRIFVADQTWGVKTWAFSKALMDKYLNSGVWDNIKMGNSGDYNYGTVGSPKSNIIATRNNIERQAASVSQYFTMGSTELSIRSSGYGRFSDYKLPDDVLNGSRTIDVTGILTMYQGGIQITVNAYEDITYSDTGETLPKDTMVF